MKTTTETKWKVLAAVAASVLSRQAVRGGLPLFNLSRMADGSFKRYADRSGKREILRACENLMRDAVKGVFHCKNIGAHVT